MFCAKCGNELKDTESFCPKCGTKVGTGGRGVLNFLGVWDAAHGVMDEFSRWGYDTWRYVACLVLQVVCLCMLKMKVYTVDTYFVDQNLTMFEEMNGVYVVAFIGFLMGIVAMVLPLLLRKGWSSKYFLLGKIMPLLSAAWVFVNYLMTKSHLESELGYFSDALEYHILPMGWIFAALCIVTAFMTWWSGNCIAD